MIETGELREGAKLPSQRDLAVDFGVSRASIREALAQLEVSGKLKTEAGRGTFVHAVAAPPPTSVVSPPASNGATRRRANT